MTPEVFMLPVSSSDKIIAQHHEAYRQIVALGGASISDNPAAPFLVAEREVWKDVASRKTMPSYLCDKAKAKYYFAEVGMPVLETYLFNDLKLFRKFADTPCILKPANSGGSSSGNDACYTLFANARDLIEAHNNPTLWGTFIKEQSLVIQRAVVGPDMPYGQLHIEAVVNGKGEAYFSSSHEIEFVNGRWTHQLDAQDKDQPQIAEIKERVRELVKLHGIKNCMLSLQHLRDFGEGTWYPTDWQYRLSYNTVWGRRVFEPEYVGSLVRYMTDQVSAVEGTSTRSYFQQTVKVKRMDKEAMRSSMRNHNIVYIPTGRRASDTELNFLFLSSGATYSEAKEAMDTFALEVGDVRE